ncbi:MAG: Bax inhibitor-1/YccA family protein [Rickettsiales bacterium]|jgi:FtsH-binding integral membrane protein|nr:Bax inhibitor-1/YccA family protein [Rickettsiales bacterium]
MSTFLKKVFAIMFAAVGVSAVASYATLRWGLPLVFTETGLSPLFYLAMFGGLGLSIFTQIRIFHMRPQTGALLLGIYSVLMGFVMTPLIAVSLSINPVSILQAFFIAALMFGCMALFGYKTLADLSGMGIFLFLGMIGLLLTGMVSMIWPLGSTAATIISAIGVLVFALFTAYDMQFLKNAFTTADKSQTDQLAVLGALHLYISFIAMFQYVLSLLNNNR